MVMEDSAALLGTHTDAPPSMLTSLTGCCRTYRCRFGDKCRDVHPKSLGDAALKKWRDAAEKILGPGKKIGR